MHGNSLAGPSFKTKVIRRLMLLLTGPILVTLGSFFGAGLLDGFAGSNTPGHPFGYFLIYVGYVATFVIGMALLLVSVFDALRLGRQDRMLRYAPLAYLVLVILLLGIMPVINDAITFAAR